MGVFFANTLQLGLYPHPLDRLLPELGHLLRQLSRRGRVHHRLRQERRPHLYLARVHLVHHGRELAEFYLTALVLIDLLNDIFHLRSDGVVRSEYDTSGITTKLFWRFGPETLC